MCLSRTAYNSPAHNSIQSRASLQSHDFQNQLEHVVAFFVPDPIILFVINAGRQFGIVFECIDR
jgi:hypothetical protein